MFETFNAREIYVGIQGVLSLYGSGVSHIVPLYEGYMFVVFIIFFLHVLRNRVKLLFFFFAQKFNSLFLLFDCKQVG